METTTTLPILDRKLLSITDEGRQEWHLVQQEDGTTLWLPRHLDNEGTIVNEPQWMPLPGSQLLFLECPIYETLFAGTRGPGKTISLLMDFAKEVGKGYGRAWRGILFRREYKDLDDVVNKMEDLFPKLFPGWRFLHSKSEYMAIWPTGEALLLRHLETEDDYRNYHGHEYPWLGFEELTQWEDNAAFLKMQSCCRASKPGIPCRVRSTTNPYGVGHNWVKRRYRLPEMMGLVLREPGEMPRVAINGDLNENFLLLHAQPNYKTILRGSTKNPAEAEAWLTGNWNVTAGGMLDDLWQSDIHTIPNFDHTMIPKGWTITRCYDHGQSHPFAALWWLESNGEPIMVGGREIGRVRGDLILWHEWYGTNGEENTGLRMPSKQIGLGIRSREEDWGIRGEGWSRVMAGPADTEIYNRLSDRDGRCPGDDMEDAGVFFERADKGPGSRKRGWEMLRTRLSNTIPEIDGTREEPGMYVCRGCEYWLDLVPSMPRDTKDQDEVPSKYEDHLADATRYRLNWEIPGMWRRGF